MMNLKFNKWQQWIIKITIPLLIFIFTIDALLYWLDPLGLVMFHHDATSRHLHMQPHPTGYYHPPGTITMQQHKVTYLENGERYTPETNPHADCKIAFIGDSVTANVGVKDEDNWTNLIARDYQNVHFVNVARGDYSVYNVYLLMQYPPADDADGYIWLMIENDPIEPYETLILIPTRNPYLSASRIYYRWFKEHLLQQEVTDNFTRPVNLENYWQYADEIMKRDNILGFAFNQSDWQYSQQTASRYDNMHLLPPYTSDTWISAVDSHPNALGNLQIYEAMKPYMGEFIDRVCP